MKIIFKSAEWKRALYTAASGRNSYNLQSKHEEQ